MDSRTQANLLMVLAYSYAPMTMMDIYVYCHLLCSKSKVAPLKLVTIPRLELSAALLLARLMDKVITSIDSTNIKVTYWTDSMIVLAWLKSESRNLSTFVANRVSEIQMSTNVNNWRHVPTAENPADMISRGMKPGCLAQCKLWWEGPTWLNQDCVSWPKSIISLRHSEIPEQKSIKVFATVTPTTQPINIDNFSNVNRLIRALGWCRRFLFNASKPFTDRKKGCLSYDELHEARLCTVKIVQRESFRQEIKLLMCGKTLPKGSKILNLNPFLDNNNLLRVGVVWSTPISHMTKNTL